MLYNSKNVTTREELLKEMRAVALDNINRDKYDSEEKYKKALEDEFQELYNDFFCICIDMERKGNFFIFQD